MIDKQLIQQLIEKYAPLNGVPVQLAVAQQQAEDAPEDPTATSSAGAVGLFQIEPTTALGILQIPNMIRAALDIPELNILLGMKYMSWMKGFAAEHFSGTDVWKAAVAAYNCGSGNVTKAIDIAESKGLDKTVFANISQFLPTETQIYVAKIWSEFVQATNPQAS